MPDVLNADEVAELLRCDRKTVYEAATREQIPCRRLGRRFFFSRAAILEWLAAPCAEPTPVAATNARSSVRREPNGQWFFRKRIQLPDRSSVRLYGQPSRWGLPNTKTGAVEAQRRAVQQALSTRGEPAKAPRPPTVAEFAPTFIAIARANNKRSSADAKNDWLRAHLLPRLGHLRLDEVTHAVIEDLKLSLLETPVRVGSRRGAAGQRTLGRKTINNGLTVLRRMLAIARRRGLIETVPEVDWFRVPPPQPKFLTFPEAESLIEATEARWRTAVTVALRTGLRRSELFALRWQDLDLDHGKLVVHQSVVRGAVGTPKSGKGRIIPLADETVAELARHRHARGPYVFCNRHGRLFTMHVVERAIKRAYVTADLPHSGWHVLRHTFASHLVMRGVPLNVVQELLGHATIQMTMRYAHFSPDVARDAVRRLERTTSARAKMRASDP